MDDESGKPAGRQSRRSTIGLATAADAATAVAAAIDTLPPADRILEDQAAVAVVVPREWRDETARTAAARIREKVASAVPSRPTLLFRTPGIGGQ
ncbi:MAG TPA: hypothetical protein VFU81_11845, partial [Thermomicrobiales bacterium]|nr:hypothetical protein [Thermomicrobiales bacterium]